MPMDVLWRVLLPHRMLRDEHRLAKEMEVMRRVITEILAATSKVHGLVRGPDKRG